jgi:formylglycine-generating enzyme required for sulfatase activity
MKKISILSLLVITLLLSSFSPTKADTFGNGTNQFAIDFVSVGNPGNSANPLTGYGSVSYEFRMGKYVISLDQVLAATANGLEGVPAGGWTSGQQPVGSLSWYQAAAFVNWLNTSKGFTQAYNLSWDGSAYRMSLWQAGDSGYDANNAFRNSLAHYFLPSENEWHKAAFGKADGSGYWLYATASDVVPVGVASGTAANTVVVNNLWEQTPASVEESGGLSDYGTMGQTGNTFQWLESAADGANDSPTEERSTGSVGYWYDISNTGSYWYRGPEIVSSTDKWSTAPDNIAYPYMSFRVASVPEPSTYALLLLGGAASLWALRRRKS